MCGTQEPMGPGFRVEPTLISKIWVPLGSGFEANWAKVGSGGFRVPGRNPKSGFRGVPGSDQIFFVPTPVLDNFLQIVDYKSHPP